MRYKHNVDLGDCILNQTPVHTCRKGIHPPLQSSETIKLPEMGEGQAGFLRNKITNIHESTIRGKLQKPQNVIS